MTASPARLLLEEIRAFPLSRIHLLSGRGALREGVRLSESLGVLSFSWKDGGRRIEARVRKVGTPANVYLVLEGVDLRSRCDECSDLPGREICAHVLAVLFTLHALLTAPGDPGDPPENAHRDRLADDLCARPGEDLRSLFPGREGVSRLAAGRRRPDPGPGLFDHLPVPPPVLPPPPIPFTVVIDPAGAERDRVQLWRGAHRVVSRMSGSFPHSLLPFVSPYYSDGPRLRFLGSLLARGDLGAELLYRSAEGDVPLRWVPPIPCRSVAEATLSPEEVTVTIRLEDDDKVAVGSELVADLREGILFRRGGDTGVLAWRALSEHFTTGGDVPPSLREDEGSLRIPRDDFESLPFILAAEDVESFLSSVRFFADGRRLPVRRDGAPFAWCLHADTQVEEGAVVLAFSAPRGDGALLPSTIFRYLGGAAMPPTVRTRKRSDAFRRAFFEGLLHRTVTARKKAMRDQLGPDVERRHHLGEILRLLETLVSIARDDHRVLLPDDEGALSFRPAETGRQAEAFRILFEELGSEPFGNAYRGYETDVAAPSFFGKLPRLRERLAGAGISLFVDGRPVGLASWDISVRASRSGLDWFELHPEVRWEGEPVSDEAIRTILSGKPWVVRGSEAFLLDAETVETLRLLSGIGREGGSGPSKGRTARELVRVPRLRILDLIALHRRNVKLALPEEDERVFRRLSGFSSIEERPLPLGLDARLRPYQREGYSWLSFLYENRFGALLADDMGLGKTVQALALLAAIQEGQVDSRVPPGTPHLVVCPPSLLFNWEAEIRRFLPAASVRLYHGKERNAEFAGADVVLTSYDLVRRDGETLSSVPFDVIVFDEAQAVKNLHAGITGAARKLSGAFRLGLTGTPLENRAEELFSLVDLVLPGLFGEPSEFLPHLRREDPKAFETLRLRSRPFLLRRTRERVLTDLPPRTEGDVLLELSPTQRALYHRVAEEARETVARAYAEKTEHQARIVALTALLRLRQVCLSPELLVPGKREASPKLAFLVEKLHELDAEGHGALVFSQFTSFLDLAGRELEEEGLDFLRLDGSTPVGERKRLVEAFQRSTGGGRFLLSLKAGGQGLNLTRASYVFLLDPWWNPAVEDQAAGRAHRLGQTSKVTVTRLLMRHTLEEKMAELKARKRKLFDALVGEADPGGGAALSRADFAFLLGG